MDHRCLISRLRKVTINVKESGSSGFKFDRTSVVAENFRTQIGNQHFRINFKNQFSLVSIVTLSIGVTVHT
jgi:hypothetical protein